VEDGAKGAFAAVFDSQGRVLVVQERKRPFRFGFPGGRIEPGERAAEAAVRECWEETGVRVTVEHLVGSYAFANGLEAHVFRCRLNGSADVRAEEGSTAGWFQPDAVPQPQRGSFRHALDDVLTERRNVSKTNLPVG
jgi:8-oxo-dGTP pyrophosphatase MutT (NUDIX family)